MKTDEHNVTYVLVITKGDNNVNLEIPNESKNIYSNK